MPIRQAIHLQIRQLSWMQTIPIPVRNLRNRSESARTCCHSCKMSADIHKLVKGLMIESYIEDGNQKVGEHCYGKSITDPCLGWEKTEKLIYELAELW